MVSYLFIETLSQAYFLHFFWAHESTRCSFLLSFGQIIPFFSKNAWVFEIITQNLHGDVLRTSRKHKFLKYLPLSFQPDAENLRFFHLELFRKCQKNKPALSSQIRLGFPNDCVIIIQDSRVLVAILHNNQHRKVVLRARRRATTGSFVNWLLHTSRQRWLKMSSVSIVKGLVGLWEAVARITFLIFIWARRMMCI